MGGTNVLSAQNRKERHIHLTKGNLIKVKTICGFMACLWLLAAMTMGIESLTLNAWNL